MLKKIICFGILSVMIFSLLACNQNDNLEAYKTDANTMLETYAQSKGQDIREGKTELSEATDKVDVDTAVNEAKEGVDEVIPIEENMEEILKQFDLTDPKILFDETSFSDSMYEGVDSIIITFKKTSTYPILELQDFNLPNAKRFAYGQATPHDGPSGWIEFDDGHQKGQIMLMEGGKEKILEAIRHLEKFEFVKSVRPLHYYVTLF